MAVPVVETGWTKSESGTARASLTLEMPSGLATGELCIIVAVNDDTSATAQWDDSTLKPTGFTLIGEAGSGTSDSHVAAFYRVITGSESWPITVPAQSSDEFCAIALRVTGVDTADLLNGISTPVIDNGGDTSVTGLDTDADNCLAFTVGAHDGADGTGDVTGTGWSLLDDLNSGETDGDGVFGLVGTKSMASQGATGTSVLDWSASDGSVGFQFAIKGLTPGIAAVTPGEFDFDDTDVDIDGLNFEASQGGGTVYISDAATLAGSANEVEIAGAVNTWSDTQINLDFAGLTSGEIDDLHTLGPGARYIIVVNDSADEYSRAITLHRPQAIEMVAGAATPGSTTQRLTGLSGTFGGGRIEETAAQNPSTTTTDVAEDGNREDVWSLQFKTAAREVVYDFRVVFDGAPADTITQTPQATFAASSGQTLTQTARLDNANTLFAAVVTAAAAVTQGARHDNANTLFAGSVKLGLAQAARLDNANTLFAAAVAAEAALTQTARLDNAATLHAATVTAAALLTQGARLDNANTLHAAQIDLTLAQAARLDNASALFAAEVEAAAGPQTLTQAARLDNANTLFAGQVNLGLAQAARLDDADALFAAELGQALAQGARLDNANALFAPAVAADALIAQAARHDNANVLFAASVSAGGDVTQGLRLDNANVLFAATVTADAVVTQAARLDNAATLFAPGIGLGLAQTARLDNIEIAYAARIDLTIAQPARLDNAQGFGAHTVSAGNALSQAARLDNASVLHAHTLTLTIGQGARLDNANALFSGAVVSEPPSLTQGARLDNVSVLFAPHLYRRSAASLEASARAAHAGPARIVFAPAADRTAVAPARVEAIAVPADRIAVANRNEDAV